MAVCDTAQSQTVLAPRLKRNGTVALYQSSSVISFPRLAKERSVRQAFP